MVVGGMLWNVAMSDRWWMPDAGGHACVPACTTRQLLITASWPVSPTWPQAAELPRADPASMGLDPDRLASITQVLEPHVK